jgi:CheY-like chemotaxis protein
MPERDGGDVALQIETDPELQRTPIVFLTALVTKAEARGGLRVQGHPTLAKPISIPDLINAVEENLPLQTAFQAVSPAVLDQMGDANRDGASPHLSL